MTSERSEENTQAQDENELLKQLGFFIKKTLLIKIATLAQSKQPYYLENNRKIKESDQKKYDELGNMYNDYLYLLTLIEDKTGITIQEEYDSKRITMSPTDLSACQRNPHFLNLETLDNFCKETLNIIDKPVYVNALNKHYKPLKDKIQNYIKMIGETLSITSLKKYGMWHTNTMTAVLKIEKEIMNEFKKKGLSVK